MIILAIVAALAGIGVLIQICIWAVTTWNKANEEERRIRRFEKFSDMMSQTNLKLGE